MGKRSSKQTVSDMAGEAVTPELRVAVCVPTTTAMWHGRFAECLTDMVAEFVEFVPGAIKVFSKAGPILPEVRHRCLGEAFNWGATHVLMLAPHLTFPPDSLPKLIASGNPVIGVSYIVDKTTNQQAFYGQNPDNPQEVAGMELGMVLFHATVFDECTIPFFQFLPQSQSPAFFEDYFHFWQQIENAGISVKVDLELSKEVENISEVEWH